MTGGRGGHFLGHHSASAVPLKQLFFKRLGDTGLPFSSERQNHLSYLTFPEEIITFLEPESTQSRRSRWEIFGSLLGSETETDKETDRETDRETDSETDKETDWETDGKTDRVTDRENAGRQRGRLTGRQSGRQKKATALLPSSTSITAIDTHRHPDVYESEKQHT